MPNALPQQDQQVSEQMRDRLRDYVTNFTNKHPCGVRPGSLKNLAAELRRQREFSSSDQATLLSLLEQDERLKQVESTGGQRLMSKWSVVFDPTAS